MQGLVQAMQMHGHTQAALQAQLEAQGESDPLLAESWMREIEKIYRAISCVEEDKVTLATYMLQNS
ncbi:hypothetical protein Taro_009310 [Colocasia esculenta]|uniref:Uncharacterized protein n=1 Tax=Colocasia esculenta TaxID=4460 RepID=A0A843TZS1_COLES|nr:hypothetical protein [Colocasia esculenta]